ncbi:MAG: hypothetical protein HWD63_13050 [Candidatus Parvibacillus calidus]|nr:MAG: hypothetical protein HWD63_13050 [Candidatus Parvibacillus calidus]
MVQLSPIVQYLILDKTVNAGVNIQAIGNISFRKVVQEGNLSRNKTEYFSNELYPGIFAEYKRFKATLGVRRLHMKYRDGAIANNGKNPDLYNPFKVRLSLSYDLLDGKQPDDNIVYPYMPPKRRHVGYTNPLGVMPQRPQEPYKILI